MVKLVIIGFIGAHEVGGMLEEGANNLPSGGIKGACRVAKPRLMPDCVLRSFHCERRGSVPLPFPLL